MYNRIYYSGLVNSPGVERSKFQIAVGARNIYLVQEEPISAIGPYQISIQWESGFSSPEVKWPGLEGDYSSPSSAKTENEWGCANVYSFCTRVPPWRAWG